MALAARRLNEPSSDMTESIPSRFPAISTTRWSRIACARRRWSAAESWAASRRGSRRSTRCATTLASETRYNADPHDLIEAVRRLAAARRRDPGDLPLASALAGRAQPDRPRAKTITGPSRGSSSRCSSETPDVRVWRLDADSYQELAWRIVEPDRPRRPTLRLQASTRAD